MNKILNFFIQPLRGKRLYIFTVCAVAFSYVLGTIIVISQGYNPPANALVGLFIQMILAIILSIAVFWSLEKIGELAKNQLNKWIRK